MSSSTYCCTDKAGTWSMLVITTAIQAMVSMAALTPPVLAPLIARELGQSASVVVGLLTSVLYVGAIVSSLLSGAGLKRFGAIRVSQTSLMLCALGLGLTSVAAWPALLAGAATIGLGYGAVTPASSHLLARSTAPRQLSLVFSIKQTGVPLGGLLAGAIAPALAVAFGWQSALMWVGATCVVIAVLSQPLRAGLDADRDPAAPMRPGHLLSPVRMVLAHPTLRRLAGCSMLFVTAQLALATYLVTFLHGSLGMGLVSAGFLLSAAQLAGVVGRVGWGYASDKWWGPRRTLTGLASLMAAGAVATGALTPEAPLTLAAVVLVVFGASAIGWNGVYLAEVARQAPAGLAGAATAGTLMFAYLGSVVGPLLFGAVAEASGRFGLTYALLALPLAAAGWILHGTRSMGAAGSRPREMSGGGAGAWTSGRGPSDRNRTT